MNMLHIDMELKMMPVIRVSDSTFEHLKHISTWLDAATPSQTIDLLVDKMLNELDLEKEVVPLEGSESIREGVLSFKETPALSFTRVIKAEVDSRSISKPNWGKVLISVVDALQLKGLSKSNLVKELHVNAKVGDYDEHGYKYSPEIGISIQGQSAPDAWKEARRLAKKWNISTEVEFQWGVNPKALHPNKIGHMKV